MSSLILLLYLTICAPQSVAILNYNTLRGLDAGLSMPKTLVKNIYPQVVDLPEKLEAF
jgi:hypothetical protein